jgi:hypothetical protein
VKTGYIILVRNPWQWQYPFSSIVWWLIRFLAGCPYNHVAMFWEADGEPFIVEADGRGICATHYNVWLRRAKRETTIIPLECAAESFALHLGKSYDYWSLLWFCTLKLIRRKWYGKDYQGGQQKMYCFELVAYAHGVPNANQILPREFLDYFYSKASQTA